MSQDFHSRAACIIATGKWDGDARQLVKVRDRNYDAEVEVVHDVVGGVEVCYLRDILTDWCEGINEHGVGILNTALAVARDEAEKQIIKEVGKKSKDGERIRKTLGSKTLDEAAKKACKVNGGITGHTLMSDGTKAMSVEGSVNHECISKVLSGGGNHVRTNHGFHYEGAGYTEGEDYVSSVYRRNEARDAIKGVSSSKALVKALMDARQKDREHPNNVVRDTDNMRTSSVMVLTCGEKPGLALFVIKGKGKFVGVKNKLPGKRKPKVKVSVFEVEDSGASKVVKVGNDAERVAARFVAAGNHKRSIALMKWLSRLTQKVGVARHTYVVGGAVRNFIIDQPIKDVDVVIDAVATRGKDAEWLGHQIVRAAPVHVRMEVNQHMVALLHINESWILDGEDVKGEDIEIATARTETYDGENIQPEDVKPSTIEEDVFRREFTFNTLMWRLLDLTSGPEHAEVIDLTGCGRRDLDQGIMTCPMDPNTTFDDDPSRMVRAIKFFIKYGFKLSPDTEAAIKRNVQKLKRVKPSNLSNMLLTFVLTESTAKKALREMDRLGLLDVIKEIAQKDKAFRNALANHADASNVAHMFALMDFDLPSGKALSFLDNRQKDRVREVTVEMSAAEAKEYIARLKQPKMDNEGLIEEFALSGRDRGQLKALALPAMLDKPALAFDPRKLTEAVRAGLGKGRRASAEEPRYVGVILEPMDARKLVSRYGKLHSDLYAHHMTIWHQTNGGTAPTGLPWGKTVELKVVAHLSDDKGQVVAVRPPTKLRPESGAPHITVSTHGVGPKHSLNILRAWDGATEKGHPSLKGKVAWVDGRDKVHYTAPPMGRRAREDDSAGDRRNRIRAAEQFPANLLPNLHTVVPASYLSKVPYREGMKNIAVYRSVPEGITEIRPGDWVTLTKSYARIHGRGTILSKKVPVGHVYWAGTDMNEWFYTPVGSGRAASHTEVVMHDAAGKERSFVVPDASVPLLLGGVPGVGTEKQAHQVTIAHEGHDTTYTLPTTSLPLLFSGQFAAAVNASGEVETVVPAGMLDRVASRYGSWDRDKWAQGMADAASANYDALMREAAKFKDKKEVPKADGKGTTTVYEYSEGQVAHRNREKAKRVEKLRKGMSGLRSKYRADLTSKDDVTRYTALVVALIDCTFERVGNEGSAKEGHFGVTGWRKKHITLSGGKATIKYVGKSGVSQNKTVTDKGVVSALKAALEGKGPEDPLCEGDDCRVGAEDVNQYLKGFGVTAKDLRGFHANSEMQKRLKAIRSGTLPKDKKEREKKLKTEFDKALEETAAEVGHEAATLKSQYLVPGLEDEFLKDGTVSEGLNKQAVLKGVLRRLLRGADEATAVFGWGVAQMDGLEDPDDNLGGGVLGYVFRKGPKWFSIQLGERRAVSRSSELAGVHGVRRDSWRTATVRQSAGLKVYLDDERDTPPGWTRVFWPKEAIKLLQTGRVSEISLDHDLGDDRRGTGYDVVLWIEEQVALHGFTPPKMNVHSANSSAAAKMEQGIKSIERLYARSGRVADRYIRATIHREAGLRDWLQWIAQPFKVIWKHHREFVSGPVDDAFDAIFKDLAPKLVKALREQEVDEEVDAFETAAQAGHKDGSRGSIARPPKGANEGAGYAWGYNATDWDGRQLPSGIRRQLVREAITHFNKRVTEEVLITMLKKVWHAVNPVHTFKAIIAAVKKHGWKLGVGFALFEVFEHFVLPAVLAALTGNPKMLALASLPIGEVIYAVVLRIMGRTPKELNEAEEDGHLDWYEDTYGPVRLACLGAPA